MKRIDVYCPSCRWRGKATGALGACTRCGEPRVLGVPPKGGTVGRPRLSMADRLRRKAAELVALADEIDQG